MNCPSRRPATGRDFTRFRICSSSCSEIQPSAAAQWTRERTAAILTLTVEGASGVSFFHIMVEVRVVRWVW
jgi:hypothetical protein